MSNQASVNQPALISLPIVVPTANEQLRALAALRAMEEAVQSMIAESTKLQRIKSGLAGNLLTGRVQIPEAMDL